MIQLILAFVAAIVIIITIASLEKQVKKLNKLNVEQAKAIAEYTRLEQTQFKQLKSYLSQNPLEAYKLLVEHVKNEEKRQQENR